MLAVSSSSLPEGPLWTYELKFDGYRALAIRTARTVTLRSRNNKSFDAPYPEVSAALRGLPEETVVDGEIVALDDQGRPRFNLLQNSRSTTTPVIYYVFDVLILAGRDVRNQPLTQRRQLLEEHVLPYLDEPIRYSSTLDATPADLIHSVRTLGLEGLMAKRQNSLYDSGSRSGAWVKYRADQGQEFVIGGYTKAPGGFDAIIFGYYEQGKLLYASRTRNGFTPATRQDLVQRFQRLAIPACPFANLPQAKSGRWGLGLTADKMKDCQWITPTLVGDFAFVEWTPDHHLRHARFLRLRDDKNPKTVRRDAPGTANRKA